MSNIIINSFDGNNYTPLLPNANQAVFANNSQNATYATTANNSQQLGGIDSSQFATKEYVDGKMTIIRDTFSGDSINSLPTNGVRIYLKNSKNEYEFEAGHSLLLTKYKITGRFSASANTSLQVHIYPISQVNIQITEMFKRDTQINDYVSVSYLSYASGYSIKEYNGISTGEVYVEGNRYVTSINISVVMEAIYIDF